MLTTNMAFEEWTEVFGSERPSGAHAPVPHPGSQWGKLPAAASQETIELETLITAGPKLKRGRQIT